MAEHHTMRAESASLAPSPSLLGMPSDIIFEILERLEVEDILRMRVTCKRLEAETRQRSLWARLRLSIEQGFDVVPGSFQQGAISQVLEQEVIRSRKFVLNLLSDNPKIYGSYSKEFALANNAVEDQPWDTLVISCQKLLPGGRFLLTGDRSGYLTCWDLSQPETVLTPVSQVHMHYPIWNIDHQCVNKGGIIVVEVENQHEHQDHWHLIELQVFEESTPQFREIARAKTNQSVFFDLNDDIFATLERSGCIEVWNWKLDTWARICDNAENEGMGWLLIRPPNIIVCNYMEGVTRVYPIPPLYRRNGFHSVPQDVEVVPMLYHWSINEIVLYDAALSSAWKRNQHHFDCFVANSSNDELYQFWFDNLGLMRSPAVGCAPLGIQFHDKLESCGGQGKVISEHVGPYMFTLWWIAPYGVIINVTKTPTSREEADRMERGSLRKLIEGHVFDAEELWGQRCSFSFCPATGRICFAKGQHLRIFEFGALVSSWE